MGRPIEIHTESEYSLITFFDRAVKWKVAEGQRHSIGGALQVRLFYYLNR